MQIMTMNALPRYARLKRVPERTWREDPANPQASEFNSQRKLDLPWFSLRHGDLPGSPVRRLRKRTEADCAARLCPSYTTREYPGRRRAEVWMVQDVEEFGAELQHAAFSKKSQLRFLHQRKVPIPGRRPGYDIAPGGA
jgi:hypothetical protein